VVVTLEEKTSTPKSFSTRRGLCRGTLYGHENTDAQTEIIKIAALLHDIGKIGIGDTLLGKTGPNDGRRVYGDH
jgi:response regulator RpfG family c-di-GMP phosphodiesterase